MVLEMQETYSFIHVQKISLMELHLCNSIIEVNLEIFILTVIITSLIWTILMRHSVR